MSYPVYYVVEGDTLPVLFDSFDGGTGASITLTGLATTDIEIYKDGGVTTRASDSGYALLGTDGIDEFGTGVHGFSIDLSDDDDAGFYAVGPWYHVVVASVTVDAQTVNFIACAFRIVSATRGLAGTALPAAAADAAGGLIISDGGSVDVDTQLVTKVNSILDDTDLIDDATSGLAKIATDVAAVLVDTSMTLQNEIDGVQTDTEDIQARLPTALVNSRMDSTVDASGMEAGAIDAILDDTVGDGTLTVRQVLRVLVAGMAAKLSGAATTTVTIRNVADSADVIVATVDADGNRSATTVTP